MGRLRCDLDRYATVSVLVDHAFGFRSAPIDSVPPQDLTAPATTDQLSDKPLVEVMPRPCGPAVSGLGRTIPRGVCSQPYH